MKKVVSFISALAMIASLAVSVSAAEYTEPTLYLDVTCSSKDMKAGDVVTVALKYAGFNVTPYDDINTGAGQKITGAQAKINIPGGIGSAAQGEQFLRPGVTNVLNLGTGTFTPNWNIVDNVFIGVINGANDLMSPSGTLFTISMTLNKAVTSDLEFTFEATYDHSLFYDNYSDWTFVDTTQVTTKNSALKGRVGATLKAPVTKTLSSIAVDKTAIEVAGGATYDLSTIVTTATYSDDSTETVTPTWSGNGVSGTTFTAPAAIVGKPQTVTLTATYEGKTATVTVTVPAAPKPEFSCSATPADPYYRKATDQVIRRFECSATNMTEAPSFLFTFASGDITKPFTVAKPTIGGGASFDFEVMILGAPENTTLTVKEAE